MARIQMSDPTLTHGPARLDYLDIAKGIGILLVVLGHHLSGFNQLTVWIYSCHMPLFFIVSGWLYSHRRPTDTMRGYVIKKAKALLYPYFVFSILIVVWKYGMYFVLGSKPDETFEIIWLKSVTTYGYHALWFLPTLFFSEIIVHRIETVIPNMRVNVVCYGAFAVCGWVISEVLQSGWIQGLPDKVLRYIGRICLAVLFCKIGMYLEQKQMNIRTAKRIQLFVCCAVISLGLCFVNGLTNMSVYRIGNFILYVILGIAGSVAVILLSQYIGHSSFFSFWGKNSLFAMAAHMDFSIEIAYIICAQLHVSSFIANESIPAVILELILLAMAIPFVNKHLRFLLIPQKTLR